MKDRDEENRLSCNTEQKQIIRKVSDKVIQQSEVDSDRRRSQGEQFLWMLHGGPGTGKSHVIKILKEELFEKRMGWQCGMDFQMAAFQAVNADQINGDTLHHALGLQGPWSAKNVEHKANQGTNKKEVAKRISQ